MKIFATLILLLVGGSALAQEPDEETKIRALKRAYQLNGNSMVRWGSIDLTQEDWSHPPVVVRTIPIKPPDPPDIARRLNDRGQ
jgi:hypothetical protein